MRNLILLLTTTLLLTSCYKNDYEDALDQISFLENVNNGLENTIENLQANINSLIAQIELDQEHITQLTDNLTDATKTIERVTTTNAIQSATIDSLTVVISGLTTDLAQTSEDLAFTNAALTDAQNNAATQSSTIVELRSEIASLELEIASIEPEIVTVVEYVHTHSTNTVYVDVPGETVYVEVEAENSVNHATVEAPRDPIGNEEAVNNSHVSVGPVAFYEDATVQRPDGQRWIFITLHPVGDTLVYVDNDSQPSAGALPFSEGTHNFSFYDGDYAKTITITVE